MGTFSGIELAKIVPNFSTMSTIDLDMDRLHAQTLLFISIDINK